MDESNAYRVRLKLIDEVLAENHRLRTSIKKLENMAILSFFILILFVSLIIFIVRRRK